MGELDMQGLKDDLKRMKLQASTPATRTPEPSDEAAELRRENADLKRQVARLTGEQQDLQGFVDDLAARTAARASGAAGKGRARR